VTILSKKSLKKTRTPTGWRRTRTSSTDCPSPTNPRNSITRSFNSPLGTALLTGISQEPGRKGKLMLRSWKSLLNPSWKRSSKFICWICRNWESKERYIFLLFLQKILWFLKIFYSNSIIFIPIFQLINS
jgi:hypothetical protein